MERSLLGVGGVAAINSLGRYDDRNYHVPFSSIFGSITLGQSRPRLSPTNCDALRIVAASLVSPVQVTAALAIMLPAGLVTATRVFWLFGRPLGGAQGVLTYLVVGISVVSMIAVFLAMMRLAYSSKLLDAGEGGLASMTTDVIVRVI